MAKESFGCLLQAIAYQYRGDRQSSKGSIWDRSSTKFPIQSSRLFEIIASSCHWTFRDSYVQRPVLGKFARSIGILTKYSRTATWFKPQSGRPGGRQDPATRKTSWTDFSPSKLIMR